MAAINKGSNVRSCEWEGMSRTGGQAGTARWRKGAKGSVSGKTVCASNTWGRIEMTSSSAEVTGRITTAAIKLMSKI